MSSHIFVATKNMLHRTYRNIFGSAVICAATASFFRGGASTTTMTTTTGEEEKEEKRRCTKTRRSPNRVAYVTDVEGDWDFWDRYVDISKILRRDSSGKICMEKEGDHFVFGGDSVDWGSGDLRFLREILDFSARYPGRVHFIAGNRDINKLRLLQELTPHQLSINPIKKLKHPYWTRDNAGNKSPLEQLRGILGAKAVDDTLANRLKWILHFTMGAPKAFEYRREELGGPDISDEEVVQSFRDEIGTGGAMRRYLEEAKLGLVMGDTLFVHGGVCEKSIGWLPDANEREADPVRWIDRLNSFARRQMAMWSSFDSSSGRVWSVEGDYTGIGGEDLMMYGMRKMPFGTEKNPGVVYNDFLRSDNSGPKQIDPCVVSYLSSAGIRRVVSGHRPHGDAALVVRGTRGGGEATNDHANADELTIITVDTCYAASVHRVDDDDDDTGTSSIARTMTTASSRRGVAVSELLLYLKEETEGAAVEACPRYDALIHGVTADGDSYESRPDSDSSLAGWALEPIVRDGWRVKGRRDKDGYAMLSRMRPGERYAVMENKYVPMADLRAATRGSRL